MSSATFFADLPERERFADLADPSVYAPVPDDWTVVLTDVRGSTAAVRAGRYRDVNYVGAASIAAVLNAVGRLDVPFVFGGDGATLVLPPEPLDAALRALVTLQGHARDRLGLELRIGQVPVADIYAAGLRLDVARLHVSDNYAQALFAGRGMGWAERRVKDPETAPLTAVTAAPTESDDPYAGLECRWQDIPSPHGETVSLLVEVVEEPPGPAYRDVLAALERIYGDASHPVALDGLRLSGTPGRFAPEVRLRAEGSRLAHAARLWFLTTVGKWLVWRRQATSETDWAEYPSLLRDATDYRKFDGVLRMVLAGTAEQRARLESFLDAEFVRGRLAYGLHVSDRAVMTCLVYERMGRQVHFVDGAEGGYTAAAVGFKSRLKTLRADG